MKFNSILLILISLILSACNGKISMDYKPLSSNLSSIETSSTQLNIGSEVDVVLHLKDASGAPFIVDANERVEFSLTGGTSIGTFSTPVDTRDGLFHVKLLGVSAGTAVRIVAKVRGMTVTQNLSEITVSASWSISITSGNNQSVIAGNGLGSNLVAVVKDENGDVLPGATVNWTTTAGTLGSSSTTSDANGLVTNTLNPGTVAGTKTVTAMVQGASTSINFTATVTPAGISLSQSSISGLPFSVAAGSTSTITMTIKDAYGNGIPNQTATFMSSGTTNTIFQVSSLTDANGQVTGTLTSSKAEVKTVAFSSPMALTSLNTPVTFVSDVAASLAVSGISTTVTAGASHGITVRALDQYLNTVTSFAGTIQFSSTDPQAVLPSNYTFVSGDSGQHVFSGLILKTAGTRSVTVTETSTSTVNGSQSGITVSSPLSASISSPTTSTYINSINAPSFPASGTCSLNGQGLTLAISDGVATVNQATSCSSLVWTTAGMNLSSLASGPLTFQLKDAFGNLLASVAATKDALKPLIANGSFTITSQGGIVNSPNLSMQISGGDIGSGLAAFGFATQTTDCASSYSSVAWQNYSSGNNYNFLTNYVSGFKTICAWARDIAGNVSDATLVQGQDFQTVDLNLSAPPKFATLAVTNGNASGANYGTTTIASGEAMRVSFTLNSTNPLASNPVSLYYSLGTNLPWVLLSNASAVGTPGTGKLTWTKTFSGANAPSSSFFLLRLVATDIFGNTSDIISSTINSGNWTQFAGNVSTGLGLSAKAVRIASHNADFMKSQVGSNTYGKIFFTTSNLGITAIDPSTGALSTYIKMNTGATETGVPGTISATTDIPTVYNMISDGDKLYLASKNGKIYVVDTVTNNISVFAGGGAGGCGVGNSTSCASYSVSSLYIWQYASLTIDPDTKAIYFVNTCDPTVISTGATTTNIKIQRINQSGGVATSVEDFAGNCAVTSAPTAGPKMNVSLYNTSALYRSNHSQLVFVPATKALYFGGVGTTPLQKIMDGQVSVSSFTAATGGTYLSSQNKVYYAKAGSVHSFTPSANAAFDEVITSYIQHESLCSLPSCRDDGAPVANAGVSTYSLFSLGGQLGIIDNSGTAVNFVRYRIISGGVNGTLQTIAGTDRFSGDGGQPNLAFLSYINRLVFKNETDSTPFGPGLYVQDAGAARLLKVEPDGTLISVAAGNGISGPGASGAPFSTATAIDSAASGSSSFNNLVLNDDGTFSYSASANTGRIASTSGGNISYLLNKTGDIFTQAEGTSSSAPGWTNGAGLAGLVYDAAGNLYFGGGASSAGPRKIMVRIAANGKFFTVIGTSTSASSADCATAGCANTRSVLNPGGFDNTGNIYLGPFDQNFNSGAGRLLFSEGTKIRYVTAPASVNTASTSTLGTVVDLSSISPTAFTYTYTDPAKTAINEIFYVSTLGKLYCYRVATGTNPNCSSTVPGTQLGPNFVNLTPNTIAMDQNNNIYVNSSARNSIYKYSIPVSNNLAGTDLDNFDGTTAGWTSDNSSHGSFVTNAVGTDGVGGSSGLAGKLTYTFNSNEFSTLTNTYTYGYSGTACAGRPGNPCVSAIRTAPAGLQARSISFWIKSTSRSEIHFRVIDSTNKHYDYQLVALDRNLSTGNGACTGCASGWYKYTADLSYPDYIDGSTPAKPFTPPSFTQLGGDKTISKFGIVVKPIGLNPSYTLSLSGDVSVDMFKIQDQATISTISQSPISRTVSQLNILTAAAAKLPSYKTDYLDTFGICSAPKSVPTGSGYTWPSPFIDSGWTFPNLIQNANIKTIRMDMFWHNVELVSGVYDFTTRGYDANVSKAIGAGLKLNMILDYNNPLYTTYNYGVVGSTNMGGWNNYVDSVINHYTPTNGNKITYEVWNEPDLSYWPTANSEGVTGKDDGLLYAQVLSNATTQIATTATNNSFTAPYVMSGGVGGVRNTYIDKFMQTGSADTVKGVGYHPYTGFLFPEFAFNSGNDLWLQLQSYYSARGLPTPDLWATEFGYGSSMFDDQGNYVHCAPTSGSCHPKSNGLSAGGREFQAIYVVREMLAHFTQGVYDFIYALTDSAMIYGTSNTCTDNTSGQCNQDPSINQWVENNFGLLEAAYYGNDSLGAGSMTSGTFGFRPKPSYYAVKTLTTFLKSILGTANAANAPAFDGALNLGISQAYGLRFHDNNKKYVVLWSSAVNSSYKFYLPSTPTEVRKTCGTSPNGNFDDCSSDPANYTSPIGTDTGGTFILVDRHPVYLTF
jgi:hypothetical protein